MELMNALPQMLKCPNLGGKRLGPELLLGRINMELLKCSEEHNYEYEKVRSITDIAVFSANRTV